MSMKLEKVVSIEIAPFGKYWALLLCGCVWTYDNDVTPNYPARARCTGACKKNPPGKTGETSGPDDCDGGK